MTQAERTRTITYVLAESSRWLLHRRRDTKKINIQVGCRIKISKERKEKRKSRKQGTTASKQENRTRGVSIATNLSVSECVSWSEKVRPMNSDPQGLSNVALKNAFLEWHQPWYKNVIFLVYWSQESKNTQQQQKTPISFRTTRNIYWYVFLGVGTKFIAPRKSIGQYLAARKNEYFRFHGLRTGIRTRT